MAVLGGKGKRPYALEKLSVGDRIRLARVMKLKTGIRDFAEQLGVSPMTLSKWENNTNQVRDDHLEKIAKLTGLDADWFREGTRAPLPGILLMQLVSILPAEKQKEFFEHMHYVLQKYYLTHAKPEPAGDLPWEATFFSMPSIVNRTEQSKATSSSKASRKPEKT